MVPYSVEYYNMKTVWSWLRARGNSNLRASNRETAADSVASNAVAVSLFINTKSEGKSFRQYRGKPLFSTRRIIGAHDGSQGTDPSYWCESGSLLLEQNDIIIHRKMWEYAQMSALSLILA